MEVLIDGLEVFSKMIVARTTVVPVDSEGPAPHHIAPGSVTGPGVQGVTSSNMLIELRAIPKK